MDAHEAPSKPVKESLVISFLFSTVAHAMLIGVVAAGTWLWGLPTYYKPSAYTVSLVDAPLVLQPPEPAVGKPQASAPQKEAPPAPPVQDRQAAAAPVPIAEPPAKPAPAVAEKLPAPAKTPVSAKEQAPEMTLPAPPDKPTPPAKQRPETSQRAAPPRAATVTEVRSQIARLRERQAREEKERERREKAQRRTAEQRIAALREQVTSGEGTEVGTGTATGLQRIRLQAYQERVREKIIDAWILPLPPEEAHNLQAIALLFVSREGQIEHLEIVQPSGNPLFDASLQQAIQRAVPLPALPDDYPGKRLEVEMRFSSGDSS
jgi:TonB family protein